MEGDTLVVATCEPTNIFALEDVKKQAQMQLRVLVCAAEDIEAVCASFKQEGAECNLDDIISDMTDVEVVQDQQESCDDLEKMAGQSPVIKFVNYLISNAIREGASDIHIEPKEKFAKVRYRIDGILFETMQAPLKMHPAIVSRIKIMANLDISERRLPQDGKVSVIVGGRAIDLRISILPTNHGEKTVIRILDSKSILHGLEQLGMEPKVCETFAQQIALPHGILLVTGPTGSGKSTTLYSALCQMDGEKLNISTVEDPVEYELGFCNQVQANEKIGLTFAAALRSLLRQDPDIIMIGEIRDNETARIAVQAALTGHLVFSTLHTNDAASSVTRLVNIGIEPYLIAASLNAVLAQRLVRKNCPRCKEQYKVPDTMARYVERAGIKPEELVHGVGCDNCRKSGYVGRLGIFELLIVDDKFRNMINEDASVGGMRRVFIESGQPTMFDDGIRKVKEGTTTIEEVLRVTQVYGRSEDEVFVENIG
jgi:type IV pilus assembly protein PilB